MDFKHTHTISHTHTITHTLSAPEAVQTIIICICFCRTNLINEMHVITNMINILRREERRQGGKTRMSELLGNPDTINDPEALKVSNKTSYDGK